jgi:hypothetical protein
VFVLEDFGNFNAYTLQKMSFSPYALWHALLNPSLDGLENHLVLLNSCKSIEPLIVGERLIVGRHRHEASVWPISFRISMRDGHQAGDTFLV